MIGSRCLLRIQQRFDTGADPLQEMLTEAEALSNSMQRAAQQGGQTIGGTSGAGATPESLRMALLVITVFPILCIYPFLRDIS